MDLAAANVEMCRKIVPQLVIVAPNALLLMVTNPVDVITYAAMKFSGWQRLNAEYAKQFGIETPNKPPQAAQKP